MFSMLDFGIKDFFDILLVSIIMFQIYKIFKGTQSMHIFVAIFGFILLWLLVKHTLGMELLGTIMDAIMSVGAIILVILFQDEIKHFFSTVGYGNSNGIISRLKKLIFKNEHNGSSEDIEEILRSLEDCASTKTGVLLIIQQVADLSQYAATGEIINARISARLIENIFFKNTPLHDGALIINEGKLVSAGCILPVSHNLNIPKHYGLRHRAALGISEKTDAIAIIVSEETGGISYATGGVIQPIRKIDNLREILKSTNKL